MYGHLNDRQAQVVRYYVSGNDVADLGAGDCEIARLLVLLGARHVYAYDKPGYYNKESSNVIVGMERITRCQAYFENIVMRYSTVLLSWPPRDGAQGLAPIVGFADTVIYLGKNVDGTVCGPVEFWKEVIPREVLEHVPARENTLIVYGPRKVERSLLVEEHCAMSAYAGGKPYRFDELYNLDRGEHVVTHRGDQD